MFSQVVNFTTLLALFAGAVVSDGTAPTSSTGSSSPTCALQAMLVQGITINIFDQMNELDTAKQALSILQATPFNQAQFMQTKVILLNFVTTGMYIRQLNQMIAPLGNPAVGGLAFVAGAQLEELGLTQNLTGNPTTDVPIVKKLIDDFTGGIGKNKDNRVQAATGCPEIKIPTDN
ncbi:hypothetical protein P8C59_004911 [Phyllachora maydis]|uniref:Uncharacterized protein n=1 Tax=Phyllachora maydis TaxID=1825666 RepID=A0AAD9I3L6_9PEZI|nr:hypothetical protein P8C59_004911 [Phyllachora maydis]